MKPSLIQIHAYDSNQFTTRTYASMDDLSFLKQDNILTWIDIQGLSSKQEITDICMHLDVHPLIIQDIFNPLQRNKIDILDNYIYCVIGSLMSRNNRYNINSLKFNLIVFKNLIITVGHERIYKQALSYEKITNDFSKIKNPGMDYLVYTILNQFVTANTDSLEIISQHIEDLEDKVLDDIHKVNLKQIYILKRKILSIRKAILPITDISEILYKAKLNIFNPESKIYFMNLYEQTSRTIQTLDFYQQLITNIYDIYLSSINNNMNKSVTTMTKYAIIFLPLSLITSFFGMNVDTPLFHYVHLFPMVLMVMLGFTFFLYRYFRPDKISE